jgi:hypothetical protein
MTEEEFAISWAKQVPNLKHIAVSLDGDPVSDSANFEPVWFQATRGEPGKGDNDLAGVRRLSREDGRPLTHSISELVTREALELSY